MPGNLPAETSARVAAFLDKQARARGRLIFAIDATGSRERTWDNAAQLQAQMFEEAGRIGGFEAQLVFFCGLNQCSSSRWTSDTRELAAMMARVKCETGHTQIARVLAHIRKEHATQPISAAVYIGDMCEEVPHTLFDAAHGLGVPCFMFQEGDDAVARQIFRKIADLTRGAYCQFSPNSARELAELLRAVAAFATGGLAALADQSSEGARKLLGQMK
jgi:hypothetical protein